MYLLSIILIAFIWLLIESDFLRINLNYEPEAIERKSWSELERLAMSIPAKQQPFWLRNPDYMQPLCGLDWLNNTMHVIPQYKIQITAWGVKNTITLKQADARILKDVATSILKPTKTERKELTASRKLHNTQTANNVYLSKHIGYGLPQITVNVCNRLKLALTSILA